MNKLQITLKNLTSYTSQADKNNPLVSNANVGWHIDHSLMVINKVLSQLEQSNEKDYKWQFNLKRTIVFFQNEFPVGKAKAPETVKPDQDFKEETTLAFGEKAKAKIESSIHLPTKKNFKHPFFGLLNKKQTLKFLDIHTNHHIKIIKRILEH